MRPSVDTLGVRTIRAFLLGGVIALVLGGATKGAPPNVQYLRTVANHAALSPESTETKSPDTESTETESPDTEPTETESPDTEPAETESPDSKEHDGDGSHSGAKGLDNAIEHVSKNLADHPNKGLRNALHHLLANRAKHEAHQAKHVDHQAGKAGHESEEGDTDEPHDAGHSGESHGHGHDKSRSKDQSED
jgi:hypothetical protein